MNDKLIVAKLGKSVGLKGFVRLFNLSDFPEQFKKGACFFDENDTNYTIKSFDKKNSLVLFEDYEELQKAKTLTNKTLYQSLEQSRKECKLKKDEYLYYDILRCDVYEDGLHLGNIIDILENANSYLLFVKTSKDLEQQGYIKEFYIPYVDFYIKKVSINEKKIDTQNAMLLLESLK